MLQNQVNVVRSSQGRPLLLSVLGHFLVLVTKLSSCLVHVIYNLKNFRLLVLAFQVNHHHTYPISRVIQQAYTSMWHRDLTPLQLS